METARLTVEKALSRVDDSQRGEGLNQCDAHEEHDDQGEPEGESEEVAGNRDADDGVAAYLEESLPGAEVLVVKEESGPDDRGDRPPVHCVPVHDGAKFRDHDDGFLGTRQTHVFNEKNLHGALDSGAL